LIDSKGAHRVNMVPCRDTPLSGSIWKVGFVGQNGGMAGYNTGDKEITAQFGKDGILRGITTCSRAYEAKFTSSSDVQEGSIEFGPVDTVDNVVCNRDDFEEEYQYENAIELESLYLEALKRTSKFAIASCEDDLVLLDAAGIPQVEFVRDGMSRALFSLYPDSTAEADTEQEEKGNATGTAAQTPTDSLEKPTNGSAANSLESSNGGNVTGPLQKSSGAGVARPPDGSTSGGAADSCIRFLSSMTLATVATLGLI